MKNLITLFLIGLSLTMFGQYDSLVSPSTTVGVVVSNSHPLTYTTPVTPGQDSVYIKMYNAGTSTGDVRLTLDGDIIFERFNNQLLQGHPWDTTLYLNDGQTLTFTQEKQKLYLVDLLHYTEKYNIGVFENTYNKVELKLYPNPTTEYVNVELDIELDIEQVEYQIFNLNGQLVKSRVLVTFLYVGDLPNGIYILNMNVNGKLISEKFVKQ